MKSPYVKELEPNQVITTSFLVHSKEIRQKKTGELYLSLLLGDRTGELDAKMWDNVAEVLDAFDRDDFVKVKGLIQIFHNRPQLTIHKVRRLADNEIDFGDFFPSSARDAEEMWRELEGVVAAVRNPHLRALLDAMLADPDIAQRLRRAPAAKSIHHAYLGGLLEHVLSVCGMARLAAGHYRNLDLDLLLTGVVLHDMGKIYELNYERGFSYSTEGQLIGHINIALRMVAEKLRGLGDFPLELRSLVEHMILSHHGQLEFGSPKLPQFPEALMLHYLDDLDSKMQCMGSLIEHDRQVDGCFTSYSTALGRTALKMGKYLAKAEVRPAAQANGKPVAAAPEAPAAEESGAISGNRPAPGNKLEPESSPAPAVAAVALAAHPLFTPRPDSPFADKLRQALAPPAPEQER